MPKQAYAGITARAPMSVFKRKYLYLHVSAYFCDLVKFPIRKKHAVNFTLS